MNTLFEVHRLNEKGLREADRLAREFDRLLSTLIIPNDLSPMHGGRELAIVRTKLEEACFYAKKFIALQPENLQPENQISVGSAWEGAMFPVTVIGIVIGAGSSEDMRTDSDGNPLHPDKWYKMYGNGRKPILVPAPHSQNPPETGPTLNGGPHG